MPEDEKTTRDTVVDVFDYHALSRLGRSLVEKFSSDLWTDYNPHDPGITMLEALSYAITDLAYRTAHPIEDLLTPPKGEQPLTADFSAAQILFNRALTETDYRKLLIDIEGVRNAWLETVEGGECPIYLNRLAETLSLTPIDPPEPIPIRGLYRVWIEAEDEDADHPQLLQRVADRLHQNRNLCEDFFEIRIIPTEKVGVCLDLDIAPEVEPEEVKARVFHALNRFISPPVRFYSLKEMLDRNKPVEQIFSGPQLQHGFIDDEELARAQRRREIHVSDLIQVIHDIAGVLAVKRILLTSYAYNNEDEECWEPVHAGEKWVLPLDPGKTARLSLDCSRFLFFKGLIPFNAEDTKVAELLEQLRDVEDDRVDPEAAKDLSAPAGIYRDVGHYFSTQNDFPLNYGIGKEGLPPSATPLRKAQWAQLKAYLLFFEQLLANYLAQLAHLWRLFSLEPLRRTSFVQAPEDVPQLDLLIGADRATYLAELQNLSENRDEFLRRRNAMLDHLLARFGETFSDYALVTTFLYGRQAPARLIEDKLRFLKGYPELSRNRAAAFNYRAADTQTNVSGLERRLRLILGEVSEQFHIEALPGLSPAFGFKLTGDQGETLLVSDSPYPSRAAAEAAVQEVIRLGSRNQYEGDDDGTRFFFRLTDGGNTLARSGADYANSAERDQAMARMLAFFLGQRIFVMEHLLFRPRHKEAKLLPICPAEETADCPCFDPYSFRISVILPYWPAPFTNMYFRRYLEKTIREHTPAHIFAKICWVDERQMADFEAAWRHWHRLLAENDKTEVLDAARDELLCVWLELRSVFPQANLHDCTSGDDENPVVLDNNMLGEFHDPSDE